jgi:hypothetical protein
MREVQFIEDGLEHNARACPKIAQGVIKLLGANGARDCGGTQGPSS